MLGSALGSLTIRQIAQFPSKQLAAPTDFVLLQPALGAGYEISSVYGFVQGALESGGPFGLGAVPPADASAGQLFSASNIVLQLNQDLSWNAYGGEGAALYWQDGPAAAWRFESDGVMRMYAAGPGFAGSAISPIDVFGIDNHGSVAIAYGLSVGLGPGDAFNAEPAPSGANIGNIFCAENLNLNNGAGITWGAFYNTNGQIVPWGNGGTPAGFGFVSGTGFVWETNNIGRGDYQMALDAAGNLRLGRAIRGSSNYTGTVITRHPTANHEVATMGWVEREIQAILDAEFGESDFFNFARLSGANFLGPVRLFGDATEPDMAVPLSQVQGLVGASAGGAWPGPNPPSNPTPGRLWWNTTLNQTFVWPNAQTGWIIAVNWPGGGGGGGVMPDQFVASWNGRSGPVSLQSTDINVLSGLNLAAGTLLNGSNIALQTWVENTAPIVRSFNGRRGEIQLSLQDITNTGFTGGGTFTGGTVPNATIFSGHVTFNGGTTPAIPSGSGTQFNGGTINNNLILHSPGAGNATMITIAGNGNAFPQLNQSMGQYNIRGWSGTALANGFWIEAVAGAQWSASNRSTNVNFWTTSGENPQILMAFAHQGGVRFGTGTTPTQPGHIQCQGIRIGNVSLADYIRDIIHE